MPPIFDILRITRMMPFSNLGYLLDDQRRSERSWLRLSR